MKKRLYRSEENSKLLGVCGGIAEYFDIDPTVVRIIWILSLCCFGSGVIAYIVCALVMPKKSEINENVKKK